jgi:hypothetical protein
MPMSQAPEVPVISEAIVPMGTNIRALHDEP